MKKLLVLFLMLAMLTIYAAAEDEGIGLSVGLEFGIYDASKKTGDEMYPYLAPMVIYENSFLDGALDLFVELDYIFNTTKGTNQDGDEVFPQDLYFGLSLGYNLFLGEASTLSFILDNEIDTLTISPRFDDSNNINGILIPSVKFNQTLDFGDLYAQVDLPINYVTYVKDNDLGLDLDFTFGWQSNFGLGLMFAEHNNIKPKAGYAGFDMIVSYENGPVYFEVEVDTYNETGAGITIAPEFDFFFNSFTFYTNCIFDGIGGDGDVIISPAIGVKFSF